MDDESFNRTEAQRDEAFMALNYLCAYGLMLPLAVLVVVASWAGVL